MDKVDRRSFLKMSAATAAAASIPASAMTMATMPTGEITVWSTSGTQRHQKLTSLNWSAGRNGKADITIDPREQSQEILGFGAAFTDAACYTLNRLEKQVRAELFHKLFHSSEIGLSVGRVCIGASDYSTKAYSFSEGEDPDPELTHFSIEHDREYILPILREARSINPDIFLLGSPWSPPAWMKFNKSMLGGSMRRKWLKAYAQYIEKFLAAYADEGVRVNSVSPQNEVDTDQDGRMPACIWPQEYEIEFVRDYLGPLLQSSKNAADIWILDHNYNLWGRAIGELEDEKVRKFVKGVAWHGYMGSPDAMTRVRKEFPQVDMFWTEGGPDFEHPGYETEWTKWSAQFTNILRNWSRCIIGWNYALDEQGNPNIGPFKCAGLVTVNSKTRDIVYGGQYWAMEHFARHILRGARIVSSSGTRLGVDHLVARNASGEFAAVLTNPGKAEVSLKLAASGAVVGVTLPADSVTTLTWS